MNQSSISNNYISANQTAHIQTSLHGRTKNLRKSEKSFLDFKAYIQPSDF